MGLAILGQHLRPAELLAVLLVVIASAGASWRIGHPRKAAPSAADSGNVMPGL